MCFILCIKYQFLEDTETIAIILHTFQKGILIQNDRFTFII